MNNLLITIFLQCVIIHSLVSRYIPTGIIDTVSRQDQSPVELLTRGEEYPAISLSGDTHNRRVLLETLKILANSLENSDDDDTVSSSGYGDISLQYYSPTSGTGTITTHIPHQEEYWVPSTDNWVPSTPYRVPSNDYLVPPTDYWVPTTSPEYEPVDYMLYGNSWGVVQQPFQGSSQQHHDSYYEEDEDTDDDSYYEEDDDTNEDIEHKTSLYEVHGIPDPDRDYQEVTEHSYPQ